MICNNPQNLQVHMSMKYDVAEGNSSQQILHIHTNTLSGREEFILHDNPAAHAQQLAWSYREKILHD